MPKPAQPSEIPSATAAYISSLALWSYFVDCLVGNQRANRQPCIEVLDLSPRRSLALLARLFLIASDGNDPACSESQIEKRGNAKARRVAYRAAKKKLELEKQQLLLGKLRATSPCAQASPRIDPRAGAGARSRPEARHNPGQGQVAPETAGAIDTVLGSLDKLVELEKRISSLEKSNVYDEFRVTKQGRAAADTEHAPRLVGRPKGVGRGGGSQASRQRNSLGRQGGGSRHRRLSFSKVTTEATIDKPSQTCYSVRVRRQPGSATGDSAPLLRRSRGDVHKSRSAGQCSRVGMSSSRAAGSVSTFLTQLPDVHRHPKAVQAGSEGFRSAVGEKKRLEAKRKLAARRAEAVRIARQDRIICEWMKRKKAAASTGYRPSLSSSVSRSGGVPAVGRQRRRSAHGGAKNVHLQEFRDIRARYAKRTDILRRDLSRRTKGPEGTVLAGTRTIAVARQKAPAASSSVRSRPGKSFSRNLTLQRGTRAPRSSGGKMRRIHTRTAEARRGSLRRVGQGLVVGGTGLRAARARRQERASFGARSTRRRDGSHSQPTRAGAVAVLPMLR